MPGDRYAQFMGGIADDAQLVHCPDGQLAGSPGDVDLDDLRPELDLLTNDLDHLVLVAHHLRVPGRSPFGNHASRGAAYCGHQRVDTGLEAWTVDDPGLDGIPHSRPDHVDAVDVEGAGDAGAQQLLGLPSGENGGEGRLASASGMSVSSSATRSMTTPRRTSSLVLVPISTAV